MPSRIYDYLMAGRDLREDPEDARLFALSISFHAEGLTGALGAALGLSPTDFRHLLNRYFPKALDAKPFDQCMKVYLHLAAGERFLCRCYGGHGEPQATPREQENADLRQLFLDHRGGAGEEEEWFARLIATACMGDDHLWQDLGFTGRDDLSDLLRRHFPDLHAKNGGNMKWKKFFYKQLCDQAEVSLCQAPSCSVCNDYGKCFGPEDAAGWNMLAGIR